MAAILIGMTALTGFAQETPPAAPAPLENNGKPMLAPFRCTSEDIHASGLSCSAEEPCAVFLELTAANRTGEKIFAAGNIHTESVTLYSLLISSGDGGHTWSEAHERIRGAGFDRIDFFDAETGWIVGQELFPIPQDPFLLVTADGGKSWRRSPILSESSESRAGTIVQLGLSGKKDGSIVIDRGRSSVEDRYVLFDSPDGGESWNVRQESAKAPVLKNAAAPSTDWRIRTDAASMAFLVEHRQGTRWTAVGAFAVKLNACVPEQ